MKPETICLETMGISYSVQFQIILFVSMLIGNTELKAQWVHYSYDYEDGVPDLNIKHMMQDDEGYIWIASESGLIQFDGLSYQIYNTETDSAFKTSNITCTFEDSEGRLWIGTWGEGIVIKEGNEFKPFKYRNDELNGFVVAIQEDSNGNIWIGTDGGGVFQYTDTLKQFGEIDGYNTIHIFAMVATSDGKIVVGGDDHGLDIFDGERFTNYPLPKIKSRDRVFSIHEDENGLLWVATSQGLYSFKDGAFTEHRDRLKRLYYPVLRDVYPLDNDNFLVSTESQVLLFHKPTQTFRNFKNLKDGYFPVLFGDFDGNKWIVKYGSSLIKVSKRTVTELPIQINGEIPSINAVTIDQKEQFWVATSQGLLQMKQDGFRQFTTDDGLSENKVDGMLELHSGELLVWFNRQPPQVFDGETFTTVAGMEDWLGSHPSVLQSNEGSIYIGTLGIGILKITEDQYRIYTEADNAPSGGLNDMAEDANGNVWLATDFGLRKMQTDTLISYGAEEGLNAFVITELFADRKGLLWIAAADGRLQVYDGNSFRQFGAGTGLNFENIISIEEDNDGYLWLATEKYIMRANYIELLERLDDGKLIKSLEVFDQSDGVPSVSLSGGRGQKSVFNHTTNEIWYTTHTGIAKVKTRNIIRNDRAVETRIRAIRIDNDSVNPTSEIIVPADNYFVEFDYAGLGFTAPEAFTYEYRLLPDQQTWTTADERRTAYYSNLTPGEYTFEVRTTNEDGITGPIHQTGLRKLPAFYQTIVFKFLLLSSFSVLVYVLYAYRIAQIRRTEKLRLQIAGDLHDEIGGNLGSIILRAQMMQRRESLTEKAKKDLNTITNVSNETAQAMRDIVWLINPENDNIDNLAYKLRSTAKQLLEGIQIRFETDDEVRNWNLSPEKRKQILLICKECMNNIRKHAAATMVEISLKAVQGKVILSIFDNGKGFDTDNHKSDGMGLRSIKRRASEIQADLEFSSSPGDGTRLILKV